jgi:hypothetical protein
MLDRLSESFESLASVLVALCFSVPFFVDLAPQGLARSSMLLCELRDFTDIQAV